MIKVTFQTFCGLIADWWRVWGVPLGGVQRWRHWGVTVLVVHLWAGEPLIVPGFAAAVSLAVYRALVPLQSALVLRLFQRAGPPGLLERVCRLWLGGAQQTSHRQHPLNGLCCAGWGRTFSVGGRRDSFLKKVPRWRRVHGGLSRILFYLFIWLNGPRIIRIFEEA